MLARLEANRVRVAELGAQIMELERSLAVLQTEKASAQERLASYKYPVLTLPNELTSEIFIHFLPVYPLCPPLTGLLSPTLLSQICRRWREVALGTPALYLSGTCQPRPPKTKTRFWLSRSRSCPLSVELYGDSGARSEALAAVAFHCKRWEHAELCLSPTNISIIEGPMPLLYHLDLEITASCTSPTKFKFLELPLLRTVTQRQCSCERHITMDSNHLAHVSAVILVRMQPGFAANPEPYPLQAGSCLRR
ncbi:hypothetical protein DFH06DRAFT_1193232 [Mycena polygramma]|nr:hypothetical protein DFH06DRAFT_1208338 [Mycena polygramma]KAJ7660762.1 hypothetical protein DFH06DRAFT_1193232 [Mycena polygramma]